MLRFVVALLLVGGWVSSGRVTAGPIRIRMAQQDVVLEPTGGGTKSLTVRSLADGDLKGATGQGDPRKVRSDVAFYPYVIECGKTEDGKPDDHWTDVIIYKGPEAKKVKLMIQKTSKGRLEFFDAKGEVVDYCAYDKKACEGAGLPEEFWGPYDSIVVFDRSDPDKKCFPSDKPLEIKLRHAP